MCIFKCMHLPIECFVFYMLPDNPVESQFACSYLCLFQYFHFFLSLWTPSPLYMNSHCVITSIMVRGMPVHWKSHSMLSALKKCFANQGNIRPFVGCKVGFLGFPKFASRGIPLTFPDWLTRREAFVTVAHRYHQNLVVHVRLASSVDWQTVDAQRDREEQERRNEVKRGLVEFLLQCPGPAWSSRPGRQWCLRRRRMRASSSP